MSASRREEANMQTADTHLTDKENTKNLQKSVITSFFINVKYHDEAGPMNRDIKYKEFHQTVQQLMQDTQGAD